MDRDNNNNKTWRLKLAIALAFLAKVIAAWLCTQ
jgi:hypothetical protein